MAAALANVPRLEIPEFTGVFRGRELTPKNRRLSSGFAPADDLLGGGIPRGRISEIIGRLSSGKTSIAAAFIAAATRRGEVVAIVDSSGAFDPQSMSKAGIDLARILWVWAPLSLSLVGAGVSARPGGGGNLTGR